MNNYKTIFKIASILCLIACIVEFIYIDYALSSFLTYLITNKNFEIVVIQISIYMLLYYIMMLCFTTANITLILLTFKKLKLEHFKFVENQNLIIWLIVITGSLTVLSSITKIIFLVSFILLIIGLCSANKKITLDEKTKQAYKQEINIADELYKNNNIDEHQLQRIKKEIYAKYYLNKENNANDTTNLKTSCNDKK